MKSSTRNHMLHCDTSHYLIRKQNVIAEDFIKAVIEHCIGRVNYVRNQEFNFFPSIFGETCTDSICTILFPYSLNHSSTSSSAMPPS